MFAVLLKKPKHIHSLIHTPALDRFTAVTVMLLPRFTINSHYRLQMLHPGTLKGLCLSYINVHQTICGASRAYKLNPRPGSSLLITVYIQQMFDDKAGCVEYPPVEMSLICIQCCVFKELRSPSSVKHTHKITSVLVCCTLVVLSCYISISPDKEAAWFQGSEIQSVAFHSIKDPTAFAQILQPCGGENHGTSEGSLREVKCFKLL